MKQMPQTPLEKRTMILLNGNHVLHPNSQGGKEIHVDSLLAASKRGDEKLMWLIDQATNAEVVSGNPKVACKNPLC